MKMISLRWKQNSLAEISCDAVVSDRQQSYKAWLLKEISIFRVAKWLKYFVSRTVAETTVVLFQECGT